MFESQAEVVKTSYPCVLGDIGGTNARFGWQEKPGAPITHVEVLPCADHPSLEAAIRTYLSHQGLPPAAAGAFGIANPVTGDALGMTNHHWTMSISALRRSLGWQRLVFLNDFTALALALPLLPDQDKRQVGPGQATAAAAVALIGPGTGLGVSGLLAVGPQRWAPISGEGGHVTLSATNELEFALIQQLQKRYGHVSAERIICGAGLVDLHHALCEITHAQRLEITTAAEVLESAREHPGGTADQAVDLFCGFLGTVAGDLALTLGARGGVYIGGGIIPRLGERFDASPFRAQFEAKGRFKNYLQAIPTWVIQSQVSPALLGASQALAMPSQGA